MFEGRELDLILQYDVVTTLKAVEIMLRSLGGEDGGHDRTRDMTKSPAKSCKGASNFEDFPGSDLSAPTSLR